MARYISMVANDGKSVDVSIVKSIIRPDGSEVSKDEINNYADQKLGIENDTLEDVEISKEDSQAIKKGMRGVTSEAGGTAYAYFSDLDHRYSRKNRFCSNWS